MTQVLQAKCPHCKNVLRIPADWLAKPMRCKYCKQVIQAKGSAPTASAPAAPARSAEGPHGVAAPPAAAAPRRASDPFSFDDGADDAPLSAAPRRRKQGKGAIIAMMFLLALTTVSVVVVVFAGDKLRELFNPTAPGGNGNTDKVVSNDKERPEAKDKPEGKDKRTILAPGGKEVFPRRALLINVNNYWVLNPVHYGSPQSRGYPGSSTAVLATRLSNAPMYFPATQVAELSDSATPSIIPQKSVIEDAISEFCNTSRDQDRILLLFAGHAIEIEKEAYLIPYEGNKDDVKTLIPLSWVYDKLGKCKARQKIFVLDAFRFPPARGFELPGTGAMSEDFEAKLHNPPAGVQVWASCVKDQQSIEFTGGSLFLQSVCNQLQERLGGFASPAEPIPIETLATKVNQRMKELLAKEKLEQVARLSGKEESGAAFDPSAPLPPKIAIKTPEPPAGDGKAGGALVNNILSEMKQIPPMKASLKTYMSTLKAEALPPFPQKVMDFYKSDYKSWAELEAQVTKAAGKYPLREAVLEAKKALDKADTLNLRESLSGPITDKAKASFLLEQKEPALLIFEMEEALAKMTEADTEEIRAKEDSKRWLANFDYTMARLKARLVYIDEYNYILGDIRGDRLPTLEGDNTGWSLGFKAKLSTNEKKAKDRAKEIAKLWKKIGEEHPNTPWALLAQRESLYAVGLEWRASRE